MTKSLTTHALCLCILASVAGATSRHCTAQEAELRQELLKRMAADQDARRAVLGRSNQRSARDRNPGASSTIEKTQPEAVLESVQRIDADNTRWLKAVVEKHGWPTRSMVGEASAHAAWLLVQHADADPKFQRYCLDLMTKLPPSEVAQTDIAYLTDRVLLAEGSKQIYGTQFHDMNGKLVPRPLERAEQVDLRRAAVGLPPLAQYAKELQKLSGDESTLQSP